MSFERVTKTYTIDLSLPEDERWAEVISKEKRATRALIQEAREQLGGFGWVGKVFSPLYKFAGGRYVEEMKSWCEAYQISQGDMALIQCSYDLSQLPHIFGGMMNAPGKALRALKEKIFGCTAGLCVAPKGKMHHVRSLDWPLKRGGAATRIFEFCKEGHSFVTVGLTGMVGVLSGMVPGAYSVTINWAPPDSIPSFNRLGPLFLLRETFEECDTYENAVYMLKNSEVSTNVFFVVCGANPGEGCVIERSKTSAKLRHFSGEPLVQANHYETKGFSKLNAPIEGEDEEESIYNASLARAESLRERLDGFSSSSDLGKYDTLLSRNPVGNEDTIHQMAFCPTTGEMRVWRRKR